VKGIANAGTSTNFITLNFLSGRGFAEFVNVGASDDSMETSVIRQIQRCLRNSNVLTLPELCSLQ
jgi:hypothetical protein